MRVPRTTLHVVLLTLLVLALAAPARAEFSEYDTATYDINALGVPKFLNINYIDMRKITKITKFRSAVGHDYSDATQFGPKDDIKGFGPTESCHSMKHYFIQPDRPPTSMPRAAESSRASSRKDWGRRST
jgi:hypothetical protein